MVGLTGIEGLLGGGGGSIIVDGCAELDEVEAIVEGTASCPVDHGSIDHSC